MLDSLLTRHKPDILDCIANLSNDEVFTPPAVANKMLDLLPPEVWSNPELRFLDPGCKSGVFLREAAKRLLKGLEGVIPDEGARREHIFKNMLYGIAITELTAQISRRTLYYSKDASSENSVVAMPTADGNIRYQNIAHTFKGGSCVHCGAPESGARDLAALESHAYLFVHDELDPTMKFDVIIGNPPYQLNTDGHGAQAKPIYHLFVERAQKLAPKHIAMIIPSRWFSGGMGLDSFRAKMVADRRLKAIVDYPALFEAFPGVEIKGGVCYFHWDSQHNGDCEFVTFVGGKATSRATRDLRNEGGVLVRSNEGISILKKVRERGEPSIATGVSPINPFDFPTNFKDFNGNSFPGSIPIHLRGATGFIEKSLVKKGLPLVPQHKVLTPKAGDGHGRIPQKVIGEPFYAPPNSVCTMTYIVAGAFDTEEEARNLEAYLKTKFARFLVSLRKSDQNVNSSVFTFVPALSMTETWSDTALYARYGFTADEIAYIESTIKEMV